MPVYPGLSPQDVHVDQWLSAVSIRYENEALIGNVLFPDLTVKKQSDKIAVFGKEHLSTYDDLRAPGTPANEIGHTYGTQNYFCDPHALKHKVPDEVVDNSDDVFSPLEDATTTVTEAIALNQEKRIRDLVYDAGSAVPSTTVNDKWTTDTSRPDKDIIGAISAIHAKTFKTANTIIIPFEVAVSLTTNKHIQELVKYNQNLLTVGNFIILPSNLWGLNVKIAAAGLNSANLGQTESLGYIWGKNVIVAYINPRPGPRSLTFGLTMRWKTRQTTRWYQQDIKSTWIQVEEHTDEKILCADCAYILKDAIA